MRGKVAFVLGAGVGYVLGTRAGRQQFDRLKAQADKVWQNPKVQDYVHGAEDQVATFAKSQGSALKDKAVGAAKAKLQGSSGSSSTEPTPGVDPTAGAPATPPRTASGEPGPSAPGGTPQG
ncbi:hypothetical protein [Cellulomonas marina]|uniref:YtxH domain-containing protein n=1 Tax=Cellulomonas marina TaxID=988821 RepID=A0A1I0XZQ5_9CELL|nr:hypothetical protein [Cellulomonas marina]GIG28475.1 hypothetical protein Cma02nite_10750 [Cellulomonas marina]SFB05678.1 hypothetical protein SAMN05421867_10645 [Cellulomonas marina]